MAIIVDGYCRVSTDPQEDNTSLDEQERCIREYCAANGLIVGMIHKETWSGYQYRERDKLSLMRERYREGKTQGVVCRTFDRLSRKQVHAAVLMDEMEHHGVQFHCIMEPVRTEDKAMDQFVRMVLAFVAEMEREKIMDRTMTGRVTAALNGKIVSGSKPMYGLTWHDPIEKDYLILDDAKAHILRWAAEAYGNGTGLHQIISELEAEGVPSPKGGRWHERTLRRILTDPRMTGQNVHIFTHKDKRSKQHLESVRLPDGTYPRIISDELYKKVLDRAATNVALSVRNSQHPERFLLRSGFARCLYCGYVMTTQTLTNNQGTEYNFYVCPNSQSDCKHYRIPSSALDEEVWTTVEQLSDHVALLEESIELAMQTHSFDDDLRAVTATLADWHAKVQNFKEDLNDSTLRGDTRAGIRVLLDNAYAMVEELESQRAELVVAEVNRDREREEYEKILAWCKTVKEDREELTYTRKRDFLRMLGVCVIVEKRITKGTPVKWDIKVRLPQIEAIIYQGRLEEIAGHGR